MIVDCDGCAVRGAACSDCVVTVLLGMPGTRQDDVPPDLDASERAALGVLAGSGLVPPLRLVPAVGTDGTGRPGRGGAPAYDQPREGRAGRAG